MPPQLAVCYLTELIGSLATGQRGRPGWGGTSQGARVESGEWESLWHVNLQGEATSCARCQLFVLAKQIIVAHRGHTQRPRARVLALIKILGPKQTIKLRIRLHVLTRVHAAPKLKPKTH